MAGFTQITVTGTFTNSDGTAAAGEVVFTLSKPMNNNDVIEEVSPVVVTLSGAGTISQVLSANDDTGTTPTDAQWVVIENITGASHREYNVTIPHTAPGGTVDLSTLDPQA